MSFKSLAHVRFAFVTLFAVAIAGLFGVSLTLAANPVKNAKYSGQVTLGTGSAASNSPISFKVSKNGKKVSGFVYGSNLPLFCQGGGGPTKVVFGSAKVKNGKFTSKITESSMADGTLIAKATLTGTFKAKRKESGRLKVSYVKSPQCNGSAPYKTAA